MAKSDLWKGFHTCSPTARTCFLLERVEHFDPWEFEALLIDTGRELYEVQVMTRPFSMAGVWFGASWETAARVHALGDRRRVASAVGARAVAHPHVRRNNPRA